MTEAEMVIAAAVLIGPPTKPQATASLQGRPGSSIQARWVRVQDPTLTSRLGPGPRSPTRLPGLEAAAALQYVNIRNNWLQMNQEEEPPKETVKQWGQSRLPWDVSLGKATLTAPWGAAWGRGLVSVL